MNWVAISRRLLVGADAARNVSLTLLVALTPFAAQAFDGSASVELSYGNRTFSASLIGDWGIVPEKLYLVGSYGAVRQQPEADVVSTASHLFGLGLDFLPSVHWMTSLNASVSPRATDTERFLLGTEELTVHRSRRNAQLLLAAGYQSAGFDALEWTADGSVLGSWYELASVAEHSSGTLSVVTPVWLVKPSLGLTLLLGSATELGLRAGYAWYSTDPTTAGGLDERFGARLTDSERELLQATRFGQSEANANFLAAPPWFDGRVSVLRRFGGRVTGRLGYAYTRYVHGIGSAHAVSTKWTFKLSSIFRLWGAVTVQYDQLSQEPSFISGYGTLGAELATE